MAEQIKNNRPRLQIKEMDKEEREMYIKSPLIMLGIFIFGAVISFLGLFKEGPPYGVYVVLGAFGFLILLLVTDWWEAFNNWRNGRTSKRSHPEIWKQMQEEKKIREMEKKKKITH